MNRRAEIQSLGQPPGQARRFARCWPAGYGRHWAIITRSEIHLSARTTLGRSNERRKAIAIIQDEPSAGRTIIEKFEEYAADCNVVFVLLTPDDHVATATDPNERRWRARQNVILELGYFLGKWTRKSGRVLLLHKGSIEIPSDIAGVTYIPIDAGIKSAGESIRRELGDWLPS